MTLPHRKCPVPGCEKNRSKHNVCDMHRARMRRYGTYELPAATTLAERFWCKVNKGPSCWKWDSWRDTNGYGRISMGKHKSKLAHRIAYELTHGPLPKGLVVRHTCDNPSCVNPEHLIAGTQGDNVHDMLDRARGGYQRGVNPRQKLSDDDVRDIRRRIEVGEDKLEIAALYDVHWSTVYGIASRRYRASVE